MKKLNAFHVVFIGLFCFLFIFSYRYVTYSYIVMQHENLEFSRVKSFSYLTHAFPNTTFILTGYEDFLHNNVKKESVSLTFLTSNFKEVYYCFSSWTDLGLYLTMYYNITFYVNEYYNINQYFMFEGV